MSIAIRISIIRVDSNDNNHCNEKNVHSQTELMVSYLNI